MKKPVFYAAILFGGSGERFCPLSTQKRPKQFLSVFGGKSLIRQAVERLDGLVPPEPNQVFTVSSGHGQTGAESQSQNASADVKGR